MRLDGVAPGGACYALPPYGTREVRIDHGFPE